MSACQIVRERIRVVVPTVNRPELTAAAVTSVLCQEYAPMDIVVVDDASISEQSARLKSLLPSSVVLLRNDRNVGYSCSINVGLRYTDLPEPEYVLVLNNDASFCDERVVSKLVHTLQTQPRCVAASPLVRDLNVNRAPEHAIQVRRVPNFITLLAAHSWWLRRAPGFRAMVDNYTYSLNRPYVGDQPMMCETINGACFLVRNTFLVQIGLLDQHTYMYMEEIVLGAQMKQAGVYACLVPSAVVNHQQGSTTGHKTNEFRPRRFKEQVKSELYYIEEYLHGGLFERTLLLCVRTLDLAGKMLASEVFWRRKLRNTPDS
jgi:GT2 family glycosyltransferase